MKEDTHVYKSGESKALFINSTTQQQEVLNKLEELQLLQLFFDDTEIHTSQSVEMINSQLQHLLQLLEKNRASTTSTTTTTTTTTATTTTTTSSVYSSMSDKITKKVYFKKLELCKGNPFEPFEKVLFAFLLPKLKYQAAELADLPASTVSYYFKKAQEKGFVRSFRAKEISTQSDVIMLNQQGIMYLMQKIARANTLSAETHREDARKLTTEEEERIKRVVGHYFPRFREEYEQKESTIIPIDWEELNNLDAESALVLLNNPKKFQNDFDVIFSQRCVKIGLNEFESTADREKVRIEFRPYNLPKSRIKSISKLNIEDANKLLIVPGTIKIRTTAKPYVKSIDFECKSCGTPFMRVKAKPKRCECGAREPVIVEVRDHTINAQKIKLFQESEDEQTVTDTHLNCIVEGSLCFDESLLGSQVNLIGYYEATHEKKGDLGDWVFHVLNIDNPDSKRVEFTDEEIKKFQELAQQEDVLSLLGNIFAPNISGEEHIKKALLLQLACKSGTPGTSDREKIHILILDKPGTGKTTIAKEALSVSHRYTMSSAGSRTSKAGVIGGVLKSKDDFTGEQIVQAGNLVLAQDGIGFLNELPMADDDTKNALVDMLAEGQVSISMIAKGKLKANCKFLATGNPIDANEPISYDNLDLGKALKDRLDLILVPKNKGKKIRTAILRKHSLSFRKQNRQINIEENRATLKRFFLYVYEITKDYEMCLDDASMDAIDSIVSQRYGFVREYRSETRFLETYINLAKAHARLRLSHIVNEQDVLVASSIVDEYLNSMNLGVPVKEEVLEVQIPK